MGERSQREAGRCMIISDPVTCSSHDTQPCGHPVCFTEQRTHSLLSNSVPLTQTGSTSPHTHTHTHTHTQIYTQAHTLPTHTQPHTASHTTHTLLTHPHSPTLTHTYSSHTLILAHSSHTPQTHTLFTPTYTLTHTHPHTLTHTHFSYPHTHTPSRIPHLHTYTHIHTQSQSLQERRHRKHRDPGAVLMHQTRGACGNSPESQLSSVTGPSSHWEPLGLLEAP